MSGEDRFQAQLVDYLEGELPPQEREQVRQHLDGCESCQRQVAAGELLGRLTGELPLPELPEGFMERFRERLDSQATVISLPRAPLVRWRRTLLAAAACAALAIGLLRVFLPVPRPQVVLATPPPLTVVAGGSPEVGSQPVRSAQALSDGALVSTGQEASSLVVGASSQVSLGQNSQLRLISVRRNLSVRRIEGELELRRGRVWVNESNARLATITPHARIVPIGTSYEVVLDEQSTRVRVFSGQVRVESAGREHLLDAGQQGDLRGDGAVAVEPLEEEEVARPSPRRPRMGEALPRDSYPKARPRRSAPIGEMHEPGGPGMGPREPGRPGGPGMGPREPGRPGGPGMGPREPGRPGGPGVGPREPGRPGGPGVGQREPGRPGGPGMGPREPGRPGGPGMGPREPGRPGGPGMGPREPGRPGGPGMGPREPGRPDGPGMGQREPGRPDGPGMGPREPGRPDGPGMGQREPGRPGRPGMGPGEPGRPGGPDTGPERGYNLPGPDYPRRMPRNHGPGGDGPAPASSGGQPGDERRPSGAGGVDPAGAGERSRPQGWPPGSPEGPPGPGGQGWPPEPRGEGNRPGLDGPPGRPPEGPGREAPRPGRPDPDEQPGPAGRNKPGERPGSGPGPDRRPAGVPGYESRRNSGTLGPMRSFPRRTQRR